MSQHISQEPPVRTVLRASRLIDGTGATPMDDPLLVIENGRIEAICRGELPPPLVANAVFVDLPGKTLLPGLIDSHVHLVFDAGPDHASVTRRLAEQDDQSVLLRALRNAQALLRSGITTARDCGDRGWVTLKVRQAIDEGLFVGPRLLCCGPPITTTAGHLHFCGNEADSEDAVRRAVRTAVKHGADFIKVMATGGIMTPGSNPRLPQFSLPEVKAITSESHRLGRRVAAHVLGYESILPCLEAGVDTFEHCNWMAPEAKDGFQFQPQLAREMARRGVTWGHTVVGIYRDLLPDANAPEEVQKQQVQRLREEMDRFRRALAAGVRMMLSSDAGVQGTPFERFVDGLEVAVVGMGVAPLAAIEACTRIPAEALGLAHEIGTLVPGRRADILVVDGDPSTDIGVLRRVAQVLRDGRVVHQNREAENGDA